MRDADYVAVVGPSQASPQELHAAEEVGAGLAAAGAVVVTGGLGGVMEAACRGARSKLGRTVGLLPGHDRTQANGWVEVAIATGLGELRNGLVVRASDALLVVGSSPGTLSEVAFALGAGKPVVALGAWELDGVAAVAGPAEAVAVVLRALESGPEDQGRP